MCAQAHHASERLLRRLEPVKPLAKLDSLGFDLGEFLCPTRPFPVSELLYIVNLLSQPFDFKTLVLQK